MADKNIKTVQITQPTGPTRPEQDGGAVPKRARTRKSKKMLIVDATKEGGGSSSPGVVDQMSASRAPTSVNIQKVVGTDSALTAAGAPVGDKAPAAGGGKAAPAATAAAPVKVVLKAAKKKTAKVVLDAPKAKATLHAKPSATRKAPRKIRVSVTGLNKKLTRAKTIRKDAETAKMDEVKKVLHRAGLVKADTKAPDTILRQMYADFMMLKNRAL